MTFKLTAVILVLAAASTEAFTVGRGVRAFTTRPIRMSEAPVDDLSTAPSDDLSADKIKLEALEIDSTIEGVVKGVSDFGAFVDFGGESDGLVHKSQLSDDFVENPVEIIWAVVPVRGVEPQITFLTARDSSLWPKTAIFEPASWHRAAADRGTWGIWARLRVAGHPYHPGGRSD